MLHDKAHNWYMTRSRSRLVGSCIGLSVRLIARWFRTSGNARVRLSTTEIELFFASVLKLAVYMKDMKYNSSPKLYNPLNHLPKRAKEEINGSKKMVFMIYSGGLHDLKL